MLASTYELQRLISLCYYRDLLSIVVPVGVARGPWQVYAGSIKNTRYLGLYQQAKETKSKQLKKRHEITMNYTERKQRVSGSMR